jgi:hypothetical protein
MLRVEVDAWYLNKISWWVLYTNRNSLLLTKQIILFIGVFPDKYGRDDLKRELIVFEVLAKRREFDEKNPAKNIFELTISRFSTLLFHTKTQRDWSGYSMLRWRYSILHTPWCRRKEARRSETSGDENDIVWRMDELIITKWLIDNIYVWMRLFYRRV